MTASVSAVVSDAWRFICPFQSRVSVAITCIPRAEPLRAGVGLELCASLLHPSNAHVPPLTGDHKTSPLKKNGIKGTTRLRMNKSSHNYPVYLAFKPSQ